jgi:hypothetical protein
LGQRNRKRGQRERPSNDEFLKRYQERADLRNAEARAKLDPLQPGERPLVLWIAIVLTAGAGVANFVLYEAGAKIEGKHPHPSVLIFSVVMLFCAIGMWRLWYQAVLAFMVLLAIMVVLFSLFLLEASNLLGFLVPPIFIIGGGFLFWKLVRVLSRLQMPSRPQPRA